VVPATGVHGSGVQLSLGYTTNQMHSKCIHGWDNTTNQEGRAICVKLTDVKTLTLFGAALSVPSAQASLLRG